MARKNGMYWNWKWPQMSVVFVFAFILMSLPRPDPLVSRPEAFARTKLNTSPALAYLSAGFGPFASSIMWVESIFSYAGIIFDGESSGTLPILFQYAVELDTSWAYPRLIAGWVIPQLHGMGTKDAVPFLKDGALRFPSEWQFRLTWAQYVLEAKDIDSKVARDSAAKILFPLSIVNTSIPQYVRNLAFTLLNKNGRPEEAMSLLLQTYEQVPDPMVRLQFRYKIGDLLHRNDVPLGSDSADFMGGIGSLLESKDATDHAIAGRILTGLVDTSHREAALAPAHQLAGQYRSYRLVGEK
jgi:hypothetical protein